MRERSAPAHSLHRPPRRPPRIAAGPRLPATSGCAPLRGRHIPASSPRRGAPFVARPAQPPPRPPRRPPRIAAGPRLPATSGCAPLRGRHIPAPPHPEGVAVSADLLSVRDLIVSLPTERGTGRAPL